MNKMLDRLRNVHYLRGMNQLPIEKNVQIINLLLEGHNLRATSRIADVSINTVTKLLVEVGTACEEFHNKTVVNVKSQRIQFDEIWSFVGAKEKNANKEQKEAGMGDVWTWTAIDAASKLIVSWFVGERDAVAANYFIHDVSLRLANRVQLTTDGHHSYLDAVVNAFQLQVDFAQLIKMYGAPTGSSQTERKYSPNECNGTKKHVVSREPNPKFISTSYVERQNLTMRMHMRRFTRQINAFSKKLENHCHAIALHFVYYNFVKLHKTLRVTPAMQADLIKRFMTLEDIVRLVPEKQATKRGSYKKNKAD